MKRLWNWSRFIQYPVITTLTTTSLYSFSSATIEPVPNDNDKPKKKKKKKKKKKNDNNPAQVDRINAHYQNRIRQMSTPEKIFSTFASKQSKKGHQLMTFEDFCEAILPYDSSNKKAADNMKNKTLDTDKTYKIPQFLSELMNPSSVSLSEFIFITSLLSIPPADFKFVFKIFDLDSNGTMDSNEFIYLLNHFKQKNTSAYDDVESIVRKTKIFKHMFGEKEEIELTLSQFTEFLFNLRNSMIVMEYERYAGDISCKLSPKAFAMSLVSYAHHSQVSYYVARVNRMPKKLFPHKTHSITYDDFMDFNKCLYEIKDILRAMSYYKKSDEDITLEAFHHTVKCITDIDLNKQLLEIMFWVLDKDGNNTLDNKEIEALLGERFQYGQAQDRVFLGGFFKCFRECISS